MSAGPTLVTSRVVALQGSALARGMLRLAGWRVLFDGLPQAQGVAAIYPHTSNWDFVVGILAKWAIGIPVTFWGKDSLFRVPLLGRWMRWLGGMPVDRVAPHGVVGATAQAMRHAVANGRFMWLALAPEGTRGAARGWRTGFYRVAEMAAVPVGLVRIDYGRREVGFDSFWRVSGDLAADLRVFAARLEGCLGRRPPLAAPIVPIDKDSPAGDATSRRAPGLRGDPN